MPRYRARFVVPVEIEVLLDAVDEDAADRVSWGYAQQHLQSTAMDAPALGVRLLGDLDGIGAETIEEV